MAQYKVEGYLHPSNDAAFNEIHEPGNPAPYSGIYRCMACAHELVALIGQPLPSEDDHRHEQHQGRIGWQLIVAPG